MPAPTIAGSPLANGGTGSVLTLNLPADIQGTDIVVGAFAWSNPNIAFTPPTGWTQIRSMIVDAPSLWIGYSVGQPDHSVTNLSSGARWTWAAFRVAGSDEVPTDASDISASAANYTTTITGRTAVTTGPDRLLLHFYVAYMVDTTGLQQAWTRDLNTIEVASAQSPAPTSRNVAMFIARENQVAAGTTTARTVGVTLAGQATTAVIAIQPLVSGPISVAGDVIIERY